MSAQHRLGVLLSGRGSNFLSLAEAVATGTIPDTEIAIVLSNRAEAEGLEHARSLGIAALAMPSAGRLRAEHDAAMLEQLQTRNVTLVCLAGYMRLLSPGFVQAYPDRILNMHPSLLPAFPGLNAQAQALAYGVKIAGCTVHFVDEQLDHGVIVAQAAVPVLPEDDETSLSTRILRQEHLLYPQAVAEVLSGHWRANGRRLQPCPPDPPGRYSGR